MIFGLHVAFKQVFTCATTILTPERRYGQKEFSQTFTFTSFECILNKTVVSFSYVINLNFPITSLGKNSEKHTEGLSFSCFPSSITASKISKKPRHTVCYVPDPQRHNASKNGDSYL